MDNENKIPTVIVENVQYVKLTKNSKGYGWEIKQISLNVADLIKVNNEMLENFNNGD